MPDWLHETRLRLTGGTRRAPRWLVLESTNRCTLSCPICGAAQNRRQTPRGHMAWEMFLGLAEQAQGLSPDMVCLHAHGEPLLHPRIVEMVGELARRGLPSQLATNGDLLDGRRSRDLLEAGLDQLVVSHPAITRENYLACRGVAPEEGRDQRLEQALAPWEGSGRQVVIRCLTLPALAGKGPKRHQEFLGRWLAAPAVTRVELTSYEPWPRHVLQQWVPFWHRRRRACRVLQEGVTVFWDGVITACSYDATRELTLGSWPALSLGEAYHGRRLGRYRRSNAWCLGGGPSPACRSCLLVKAAPVTLDLDLEEARGLEGGERQRWIKRRGVDAWRALAAPWREGQAPAPEGRRAAGAATG